MCSAINISKHRNGSASWMRQDTQCPDDASGAGDACDVALKLQGCNREMVPLKRGGGTGKEVRSIFYVQHAVCCR